MKLAGNQRLSLPPIAFYLPFGQQQAKKTHPLY